MAKKQKRDRDRKRLGKTKAITRRCTFRSLCNRCNRKPRKRLPWVRELIRRLASVVARRIWLYMTGRM